MKFSGRQTDGFLKKTDPRDREKEKVPTLSAGGIDKKGRMFQSMQNQEEKRPLRVTAGFDGYVDTIARAVREKRADGSAEYFSTIAEFGAHISSKAGKSALMELHTQQMRMGGCMALYTRALLTLGVEVTAVGAMGWPETHPVFDCIVHHPACKAYSVARPGRCEAVEFDDGKMMFAHNEDIEQLDAELLHKNLGSVTTKELFADRDLIALFNWSELTHATGIWKSLADELRAPLLVDLADLSMRSDAEIEEMFALLSMLARRAPLTLSLNRNELEQLCRGLRMETVHPVQAASMLHERLHGSRVVVHLTNGAFCICRGGLYSRQNVHHDKPVLSTGGGDNFNAGLTVGLLSDLHMNDCLALANAVSGWYVSHGESPTVAQAASLLATGDYDHEMMEI